MDKRYELYCLVDPLFYDSPMARPERDAPGEGPARSLAFGAAGREVPDGWARSEKDDWVVVRCLDQVLPEQGWKVHVSACLDNADGVLDLVWDYCTRENVTFKFLRGRHLLHMRNAKYADRGSSGKLVTIYPTDDAALEKILADLSELLPDTAGPYILSDLRIGAGPLYVRYGAFSERYCVSPQGTIEPAIAAPDGTLVPDRRDPVFKMPSWVTPPGFLQPHLAARAATTMADLPYTIEKVLHFSNGGGVYLAVDRRSGEKVVLKEARPYAGLDYMGQDAVARLEREREVLERLSGLDVVPRLFATFDVGEHRFLAMEFVEGQPLNRIFTERYPLGGQHSEREKAEYVPWATGICAKVEQAVRLIHERGLVFGDVHLSNIIVRPDGGVTLIDFEMATPIGEAGRMGLANPGFAAPAGFTGVDIDNYALACLRLALFLPLTELFMLERGKAAELAEAVRTHFSLPAGFLREAVEAISPPAEPRRAAWVAAEPGPARWPAIRDTMTEAILASATPERDDRLFPGDIGQFSTGGLNLAFGAAGVLYALNATGAGRFPDHEEWLVRRALNPAEGNRLGFYEGLHGVAYALAELGRPDEALELVEIVSRERWETLGSDLFGGLAGIGLNLAHLADRTGENDLLTSALKAADVVASRLGGPDDVPTISGEGGLHAGLMNGSSGPALLFIRLYERTGDTGLLDLADVALRQDLRRCTVQSDGSLQVNEGWRTMPYLDRGSVGIAWVLREYLRHRPGGDVEKGLAALDRAARSPFYIQSGLLTGRAGVLAYLAAHPDASGPDGTVLDAQLGAMGWHAMPYKGHTAFPGERLLRLSMDLATGTAGVLLAVGAAIGETAPLPFLAASRPAAHLADNGKTHMEV
ncbi:class III lanthionine synthetase LanKC [Sinosporangium siamense]|uniref:non-specific serine/threonine protein kinase n=1 Tax=Sinosporangium siamense TaxID=1367973 RepID=A0A919RD25_9ACTN|nr:class III lanthionine synthetase LanKC [Sinosporangium siamense]GII91690.1 serine/threonine protein kinase [Sinosporangium siamense]